MATQSDVRTLALGLPEATSGEHHGTEDVRVRNKIFATIRRDGSIALKTTPANLAALISADPAVFSKVWGERWVGVDPGPLGNEHLLELITDSWKLAAPKTLVRALEADRAG